MHIELEKYKDAVRAKDCARVAQRINDELGCRFVDVINTSDGVVVLTLSDPEKSPPRGNMVYQDTMLHGVPAYDAFLYLKGFSYGVEMARKK